MIIPNNIPTDFCRDARSLRPLIINKLVSVYFGRTGRASLHFRIISSLGVFMRIVIKNFYYICIRRSFICSSIFEIVRSVMLCLVSENVGNFQPGKEGIVFLTHSVSDYCCICSNGFLRPSLKMWHGWLTFFNI